MSGEDLEQMPVDGGLVRRGCFARAACRGASIAEALHDYSVMRGAEYMGKVKAAQARVAELVAAGDARGGAQLLERLEEDVKGDVMVYVLSGLEVGRELAAESGTQRTQRNAEEQSHGESKQPSGRADESGNAGGVQGYSAGTNESRRVDEVGQGHDGKEGGVGRAESQAAGEDRGDQGGVGSHGGRPADLRSAVRTSAPRGSLWGAQ